MLRKHIKIYLNLILVFCILISIGSYSAQVSDNDGAAFITQAEFDSLKNLFQVQINNYNSGIDNKIESAISSYIEGVNPPVEFKQISLINQLKSFHFTRNFNYFGKQTNIGDYYKYWSWYSFAFALDHVSVGTAGQYGFGLRGGTNVTEPRELDSGTDKSNYIVCGKANYDSTKIVPNYGIETYNYYYMLVMGSVYSATSYQTFSTTYSKSYTGALSDTTLGIRFYNDSITYRKYASSDGSDAASIAYNVTPMDVAWTFYDANALPGNVINSTAQCHYIKNEDTLTSGGTDGTFNASPSNENLYWHEGSGRQNGTGTITLNITKYKRKYATQNYTSFIVDVVSQLVDNHAYYYNGLPLFKASEEGKVSLKITPINNRNQNTVVRISEGAFSNVAVGSGGIDVPNSGCTFTDWNMVRGDEY